jgi:hypothetical protein
MIRLTHVGASAAARRLNCRRLRLRALRIARCPVHGRTPSKGAQTK